MRTFLDTSDNQLSGSIPPFANCSSLSLPYASNNKLSGSIPISLCKCTNLLFLNVGAKRLTGTIPTEMGVSNPALQALVLKDNMLEGEIPESILNMRPTPGRVT